MIKIFIARHGQNLDNANGILNGHRNEPLTEKGIEQAEELAQKIHDSGMKFTYIYTSPLSRAAQTADIVSRAIHGPSPITELSLIERDFGIMTGVEQSRVEELCAPAILKAQMVTYFLRPKGAETFPDLIQRAKGYLKRLQVAHDSGSILLVTHGDFGKMIYAAYYGLDWEEVLRLFHFGNSELIQLSPDSSAEAAHVFTIQQHNT